MNQIIRVVCCAFLLFFISCGERTQPIPGEGPIQQFARKDRWLYVYASRQATRSDLIRMTAFGPFEPGLSPRAAVERFGQPHRMIPRSGGAEYAEYLTPLGRFQIGSEESAGGFVGYPLYFFPNDRRPEVLFPDYILRHIRLTADKEVVMLFECGYAQPFMHATLEAGQIETVVWVRESELARRPSPEQCAE